MMKKAMHGAVRDKCVKNLTSQQEKLAKVKGAYEGHTNGKWDGGQRKLPRKLRYGQTPREDNGG